MKASKPCKPLGFDGKSLLFPCHFLVEPLNFRAERCLICQLGESPIFRWEHWGSEKLSTSFRITQVTIVNSLMKIRVSTLPVECAYESMCALPEACPILHPELSRDLWRGKQTVFGRVTPMEKVILNTTLGMQLTHKFKADSFYPPDGVDINIDKSSPLISSYFWKRSYGGIYIKFMRQLCFNNPFAFPNRSLTKPGTQQPSVSSLHHSESDTLSAKDPQTGQLQWHELQVRTEHYKLQLYPIKKKSIYRDSNSGWI